MTEQSVDIGHVFTLHTGDATVLAIRHETKRSIVLCHRQHPHHAYATWQYRPASGALMGGHYFRTLAEAQHDFNTR